MDDVYHRIPMSVLSPISRSDIPVPHRWSREEYHALADLGYFQGEKVQLIEGEIFTMPPQKEPHSWSVMLTTRALTLALVQTHFVRPQLPLALGVDSEPEPDVAVIPLSSLSSGIKRPTHADLIVEVSDASLKYDRTTKLRLYARNNIPEYWIVNLIDKQLEVYRDPLPDNADFQKAIILSSQEQVSPLCRTDVNFSVREFVS